MPDIMNAPSPLIRKLESIAQRFTEIENQLNEHEVASSHQKLAALSKERGQLDPIVSQYRAYQKATAQVDELRAMAKNKADAEMAELAASELPEAEATASRLLEELKDEF